MEAKSGLLQRRLPGLARPAQWELSSERVSSDLNVQVRANAPQLGALTLSTNSSDHPMLA